MSDKTIKMVKPCIGDLVRYYDAKQVLWQGLVVGFDGKDLLVAVPAVRSLIWVPVELVGVVEENWWARSAVKMLWKSMIQRCHNPRNPSYPSYGGRGITVCDRWRSYALFALDMGPRPAGTTLDRIDNDRGYEPGNVRWATKREQALNRETTRLITFRGQTKSISDWSRETGIDNATISCRIDRGWPLGRALFAPPDLRFRKPRTAPKSTQEVHKRRSTRKPVYVVDNRPEVTL